MSRIKSFEEFINESTVFELGKAYEKIRVSEFPIEPRKFIKDHFRKNIIEVYKVDNNLKSDYNELLSIRTYGKLIDEVSFNDDGAIMYFKAYLFKLTGEKLLFINYQAQGVKNSYHCALLENKELQYI